MKHLDILYATNRDYLNITLASILSVIDNSQIENIRIHMMTEGFLDHDYKKVQILLDKFPNVTLSFYPIEEFHLEKYQIPGWQDTQVANARLFFQKILGKNLDNIEELLYLDSDTIVTGDLNDLNQYHGKIHAVLDNAHPSYIKDLGVSRYFNSGVLKINTNWWKKEDCEARVIKFMKDNPTKKLIYPDQDVLNCTLETDIEELPMSYNLSPAISLMQGLTLSLFCDRFDKDLEMVKESKINPKILHSYGLLGIKPWTNNKVNPYNNIFRKYIYEVNPDFKLQELSSIKKILSSNPVLFNSLFLVKSYTPECLQDVLKETALTFYKKKETSKK